MRLWSTALALMTRKPPDPHRDQARRCLVRAGDRDAFRLMKRAFIRFAVWLTLLSLALLVGLILGAAMGGLLMLILLPFVFMAWIDLGRALRGDGRKFTYLLGVLVGFPQVLLALAAICCGSLLLAVHFWAGDIATWWMPPLGGGMCLFGILWIRDVLKKGRRERHQPNPLMQPTGHDRPGV